MSEKFYMTKGTKKVVKWSMKILLIVLLVGIGSKVYVNKIGRILSSCSIGNDLPYSTSEIKLPGSTTKLNLSTPTSAENSINNLLKEIEHMVSMGIR